MKKLIKVLLSKKVMGALLLLLQLGIFYMGFYAVSEYTVALRGGTTVIAAITMFYIINRDYDGSIKLSWIILIALMPILGICLYIFIKLDLPSVKIKNQLKTVYDATSYLNEGDDFKLNELVASEDGDAGIVKYLHEYANSPAYSNTYAGYLPLGDKAFPVMIEELKKATKFIFIEYFIINEKSDMWQSVYRILREKIHEGVEVRVIYDGMGSLATTSSSFGERLHRHGIKAQMFAPVKPFLSTYQNNRDHRKIIVIDGKVAFSGGINIADEYINKRKLYGHWKDNAIMLKGDAVKSFTLMFLRMWDVISRDSVDYEKYVNERNMEYTSLNDGYVVPFDDSPFRDERVGKSVYTDMINRAGKYVYIMTPYLVLDESVREALKYASKRGVDVKLILPHIADKWYAMALARTYYPELLKSGVAIYEYTHGFVHSKTTLSDDMRAVVGTINYDYRSMFWNYECGVYLCGNSCIEDIKKDFEETLRKSKLYTLDDYYKSSIVMRMIGGLLKVFAPLM